MNKGPPNRGTYAHPQVALHIANWASPECNRLMLKYIYEKPQEDIAAGSSISIADVSSMSTNTETHILLEIEYPQVDDEQTKQLLDETTDINNPYTVEYVVGCVLGRSSEAFDIYMKFGNKKFNKSWVYVSTDMKLKYLTNERGVNVLKMLRILNVNTLQNYR
jgi:hypothetical protein